MSQYTFLYQSFTSAVHGFTYISCIYEHSTNPPIMHFVQMSHIYIPYTDVYRIMVINVGHMPVLLQLDRCLVAKLLPPHFEVTIFYHIATLWYCSRARFNLTAIHRENFMRPTWGPPRSCWPQMGTMLSPWMCYQKKGSNARDLLLQRSRDQNAVQTVISIKLQWPCNVIMPRINGIATEIMRPDHS